MPTENVIVLENSGNEPTKMFVLKSDGIQMAAVSGQTKTSFVGVADNDVFQKSFAESKTKLLLTAVNNRTRERNYFQLYSRLLDNEITEDEFDAEIDDHPDLYVVDTSVVPTKYDLTEAGKLAKCILCVDTPDDFLSLFSFSEDEAVKHLIVS